MILAQVCDGGQNVKIRAEGHRMIESYAKSLEKLREQSENLPGRTEWPDPKRPPTEIIRFFANAGQWLYSAVEQGAITIPDWPGYMRTWPGWEYESFAVTPEYAEPVAVGGADHWTDYSAYWPACLGHMVANAAVPVNSDRPGEFGRLITQWHDEWLPAIARGGVPKRFHELPLCPPDLWCDMCRVTEQAFVYFADQLQPGEPSSQSARTSETPTGADKPKGKRGPKPKYDAAKDRRIHDARKQGLGRPALAREFYGDETKVQEVERALDRERKRQDRADQK